MKSFNPKPKQKLESVIQKEIIAMLRNKEWFVKVTNGNMYQTGFPDLYCCHSTYKERWIEVKRPTNYKLQPSQMRDFPKLSAHGSGVWILTSASEQEYNKLFKPENWWHFILN